MRRLTSANQADLLRRVFHQAGGTHDATVRATIPAVFFVPTSGRCKERVRFCRVMDLIDAKVVVEGDGGTIRGENYLGERLAKALAQATGKVTIEGAIIKSNGRFSVNGDRRTRVIQHSALHGDTVIKV